MSVEYNEHILKYFNSDQHVGEWSVDQIDQKNILHASIGSLAQAVVLQLQIQLDKNQVKDAKFKVYGDPFMVAAMACLVDLIIGKPLTELKQIKAQTIMNELQMPALKHYCAVQVISVLQAVLRSNKSHSEKKYEGDSENER